MNGEIIIYDEDDNYDYKRIKIGNGIDNVNDLDFVVNKNIIDTILDGKADKEHTHNAEDIIGLDIGTGGTAAQVDWSEEDSTANTYINNKPFYEEGEEEILFTKTFSLYDLDDKGTATIQNSYDRTDIVLGTIPSFDKGLIVEGRSYKVTFDGQTYNLLCQSGPTHKNNVGEWVTSLFLGNFYEHSNRTISDYNYTSAPFMLVLEPNNETSEYFTMYCYGQDWKDRITEVQSFDITIAKSSLKQIEDKYVNKELLVGENGWGKNSEVFNNLEPAAAFGESSHAEGYSYASIPSTITPLSTVSEVAATWSNVDKTRTFTIAAGKGAHAEGYSNCAVGDYSHAEGAETVASGNVSHAEGLGTRATNYYAHSEGVSTQATGVASHAEGSNSEASGEDSHAEGYKTEASGWAAHAEGTGTVASGSYSHASGTSTIAASQNQFVFGRYNIKDENHQYVHIIGNGDPDAGRSNIHTVS